MQRVTLYHNPGCKSSRGAMELLNGREIEFETIEYLKHPPTRDALEQIIAILEGPVTAIAESALPAEAFDVVTQFGYIEHEWHPLAGLRAAYRVLKPGGVTVMKTPNYASWNRHIRGMNWCGYHIPAHCNYFTPRTLSEILRKAGFEPLPRPLADSLPTSDSLWMAARKPK